MTDYCLHRLGYLSDLLTEREATKLYREAANQPGSDLTGDTTAGFRFWTTTQSDRATPLKLVLCTITPLRSPAATPQN